MANLKDKIKDREARMKKAMGDEDLEKKEYEAEFDSAVTLDELKAKKKQIMKEYAKTDDDSLIEELKQIEKKIMELEKK